MYLCAADLTGLRVLAARELSYHLCRSKLAEVIEKALKAELIRAGWTLRRTHDLNSRRKLPTAAQTFFHKCSR